MWFTNMDVEDKQKEMVLSESYYDNPQKYPKYVNYDAIEVGKTSEIPYDYDGEMGVPITFLHKYNPRQFEIIGQSRQLGQPMQGLVESDAVYSKGGVRFYLPDGNKRYRRMYDRVVIKRRKE